MYNFLTRIFCLDCYFISCENVQQLFIRVDEGALRSVTHFSTQEFILLTSQFSSPLRESVCRSSPALWCLQSTHIPCTSQKYASVPKGCSDAILTLTTSHTEAVQYISTQHITNFIIHHSFSAVETVFPSLLYSVPPSLLQSIGPVYHFYIYYLWEIFKQGKNKDTLSNDFYSLHNVLKGSTWQCWQMLMHATFLLSQWLTGTPLFLQSGLTATQSKC